MVVDLPAPLGPKKPVTPVPKVIDIWFTAFKLPKLLVKFVTCIMMFRLLNPLKKDLEFSQGISVGRCEASDNEKRYTYPS